MKTIQITNTYSGKVLELVQSCTPKGFNIRTLPENSTTALEACIADADYLLASGRVKITHDVLKKAKKLKMIQRTGVGLDSIDLTALKEFGIPLFVNQGINSQSVAEHTILLILAALRQICMINNKTKAGIWKKQEQGITTHELSGKTVGIIGMGNIGQKVSKLLKTFGANVIYYDQNRLPESKETALGILYSSLNDIFLKSEIISLHCPLNSETKYLLREETFKLMREGVIIVNTARGQLINESDLLKALLDNKVGFACLDVHENEPITNKDPLTKLDTVIMTPHIGGITYDSFYHMISSAMNNIYSFDQGDIDVIKTMEYRYE